ncbi:hypothetical protein NIES4102_00800 [Chondrocystis sp. NIES-4102]|nr:hypothetical protein NIES4102_00800 [Chondrocystis sp. NIES-4102]
MLLSKQVNQCLNNDKKIHRHQLIWLGIVLSLLLSSCGESRLTQCEQIFRIAQGVKESSNNVSYSNNQQAVATKSWLESASMLNQAAEQIKGLHINDSELISYQNQLINIYRIYSQATYDAVQARESENLEALETARDEAKKAGEMQRGLIKQINAYCLNQ